MSALSEYKKGDLFVCIKDFHPDGQPGMVTCHTGETVELLGLEHSELGIPCIRWSGPTARTFASNGVQSYRARFIEHFLPLRAAQAQGLCK